MKRFAMMAAAVLGGYAMGADAKVQYGKGPNADGDAWPDSLDKCPQLFGPAWNGGCPDNAGVSNDPVPPGEEVPDYVDPCQLDNDDDGVQNCDDLCPNSAGPVEDGGCETVHAYAKRLYDIGLDYENFCDAVTHTVCDWYEDATDVSAAIKIGQEDLRQIRLQALEDATEATVDAILEAHESHAQRMLHLSTPPNCPSGYHAQAMNTMPSAGVSAGLLLPGYTGVCVNSCKHLLMASGATMGVVGGVAIKVGSNAVGYTVTAMGTAGGVISPHLDCIGPYIHDPN